MSEPGVLGIDVGGTAVKSAVVTATGEVRHREHVKTGADRGAVRAPW
jgi:predicted NBD/HSP70 family sugar kinase